MPPGSGVPVLARARGPAVVDVHRHVELVGLGQRPLTAWSITALKPRPRSPHGVPGHFCSSIHSKVSWAASNRATRPVRSGCRARPGPISLRIIAVAGQVALDPRRRCRRGVEVHDADVAVAVEIGDRGGGRPGDRVVAAEDHRHDAAAGDRAHALLDVGVGHLVCPCGQYASPKSTTSSQSKIPAPDPCGRCPFKVVARIARGPNRAPGRLVVPTSNGAPTIATSGFRVELSGLGQKRPVTERGDARVGQIELFGRAGRQITVGLCSWPELIRQTLPAHRPTRSGWAAGQRFHTAAGTERVGSMASRRSWGCGAGRSGQESASPGWAIQGWSGVSAPTLDELLAARPDGQLLGLIVGIGSICILEATLNRSSRAMALTGARYGALGSAATTAGWPPSLHRRNGRADRAADRLPARRQGPAWLPA